jgi:uncharacterized protein YdeI (YjbR/CyaY-like superfamily)
MEVGETLYVTDRAKWRKWLERNYRDKPEIWLVFYRKASGKARIPYDEAVEEALCFGWIDSIVKPIDDERFAQRFTPRRPNRAYSQLNKERLRKLAAQGKVQPEVLESVRDLLDEKFEIPPDILERIKANKEAWKNLQRFPERYKRIRIAFIEGGRRRPEVFEQRLSYFVKQTALNRRYGSDLGD